MSLGGQLKSSQHSKNTTGYHIRIIPYHIIISNRSVQHFGNKNHSIPGQVIRIFVVRWNGLSWDYHFYQHRILSPHLVCTKLCFPHDGLGGWCKIITSTYVSLPFVIRLKTHIITHALGNQRLCMMQLTVSIFSENKQEKNWNELKLIQNVLQLKKKKMKIEWIKGLPSCDRWTPVPSLQCIQGRNPTCVHKLIMSISHLEGNIMLDLWCRCYEE